MSRLRFSRLSGVGQMLSFVACKGDNFKCAPAGTKYRNPMFGEKEVGFERAFAALVGVRLSFLKFNRNNVLILMWHLRYGSQR